MDKIIQLWDSTDKIIINVIERTLIQLSSLPLSITVSVKAICTTILIMGAALYLFKLKWRIAKKVYVRDFSVFTTSDPKLQVSNTDILKIGRIKYKFGSAAMTFSRRCSLHNGLGPRTQVPPGMIKGKYSIEDAREEAGLVMFPTVEKLLEKTGINARQIDVVVTTCSLFCPTPSLSATIVNKFKMRNDIDAYSLGGMGCSAGLIGADLIAKCLRQPGKRYGLLVSTENITQNFYRGKEKSMLLPNVLFRMGCAAILFTTDRKGSKYEMVDFVKVHIGANDEAFNCIYQTPDSEGIVGVRLAKTITANASKALQINMSKLFRKVLPLWILADYVIRTAWLRASYWYNVNVKHLEVEKPAVLMPRVKSYFNHFCFHTGGKAVIDAMQTMFSLDADQIAASKAALWRYGNTSSASVWYELAYHESVKEVRKGNIVWQIAFGSGFKCNSVVWKALRDVKEDKITWFDETDKKFRMSQIDLTQELVDKDEQDFDYDKWQSDQEVLKKEQQWEEVQVTFQQKLENYYKVKQTQSVGEKQ